MLRKIVFLIPAMLLGFMTTAQYDYTQFRYADVDVRGLSMNPDADFGKKIAFSNSGSGVDLFGMFTNASVNYFHLVNLPNVQSRIDFNNSFLFNWYKDENNLEYAQYRLNSSYLARHTKFNGDQRFKETVFNILGYGTRFPEYDGLNPNDRKENWYVNPQVEFEYNVGKGRIEPIGPVFLARFIVEDLKKEARPKEGSTLEDQFMMGISKEWSQEELFELGRLIATQQNRRVFDLRVRIKDQIRKVVEHIAAKKQLDALDVYGIVADNWQFAYQFNRSSGSRAYWGLAPKASMTVFNNNTNYITSLSAHRGWRKEVPVSYKRQKSIEARIGAGVSHYINNNFNYNHFYFYTRFQYDVGYFPSSRTFAGLAFSLDGEARYRDETEVLGYNISPAIRYNASYFISYNTRLNLDGRISKRYFKTDDFGYEDGNLLISAGLIHNFY
jgi:hypothetical protein